ncbi:hypothetical protein K1719_005080 [Acacia pycnantha]|nr:hypothetical protein K1719_005080 [Acacia pycnantha]
MKTQLHLLLSLTFLLSLSLPIVSQKHACDKASSQTTTLPFCNTSLHALPNPSLRPRLSPHPTRKSPAARKCRGWHSSAMRVALRVVVRGAPRCLQRRPGHQVQQNCAGGDELPGRDIIGGEL